ncbi:ComF family protein [Caproiciproducens sp. NJN-50]|uniref:ComF family protein n=1 Tax=Acutalibacteraceae TaxID=3082771 RepID=UPI000FFE0516|nr:MULTISPECIES: ComF family protein [Acutalibacteraceae]QAT49649.1 ComF family protein [Caproiciproducens sp. NJN-50]
MSLKRILFFCLELFFPPRCVFCDKIISPGTKICKTCAAAIAPVNALRCMNLPGCGQNIPCIVLYPYESQVRDSIIRFKFYGEKKNADFYAEQLSELVRKRMKPSSFDLVTAVPISRERKQGRGYNQSELVARKVADQLGLSYEECLEKVRDNPEQHLLPRLERLKNVAGVYRADGNRIAGKRILLIDDIVTTGSTLCECAEVLLKTGARTVSCAAVAQVGRMSG